MNERVLPVLNGPLPRVDEGGAAPPGRRPLRLAAATGVLPPGWRRVPGEESMTGAGRAVEALDVSGED